MTEPILSIRGLHKEYGTGVKALKSVDNSITINPNVDKSHVLRGRILIEQSDLEGALLAVGCHNEVHLYKTADKSELFPPVKEEKKEEKK